MRTEEKMMNGQPSQLGIIWGAQWRQRFFLNCLEDDNDEHSSMDAQTSIKDKADFGLRRNSKEKDQSESLHGEVEGSVEHSTTDTTISPMRIRWHSTRILEGAIMKL